MNYPALNGMRGLRVVVDDTACCIKGFKSRIDSPRLDKAAILDEMAERLDRINNWLSNVEYHLDIQAKNKPSLTPQD